jgi:hypothetical protein
MDVRRVAVVTIALGAALAAVSPAVGRGRSQIVLAAGVSARTWTYRDSTGESRGAADISTIAVSSDRRAVTFSIRISRRTFEPDMGLQILIDADQNPGTGAAHFLSGFGVDDLVTVLPGYAGFARWNSEANDFDESPAGPVFSYSGGIARISVPARALGKPVAFNFAASTVSGLEDLEGSTVDITNADFDFAPDPGRGSWTFAPRGTHRGRAEPGTNRM